MAWINETSYARRRESKRLFRRYVINNSKVSERMFIEMICVVEFEIAQHGIDDNLHLLSDPGYDWSVKSIEQIIIGVAQTSAIAATQISAVGCGAAWLIDRALQALREAGTYPSSCRTLDAVVTPPRLPRALV